MLIAAAVIPSLVLMFWFHRRDANPEPQGVLWRTLGLGVLTIIPVLVVVMFYRSALNDGVNYWRQGALVAFWGAAVPEEFFKYLVVVLYAARHREFDEPMDGVVYGVAASLGFATLENIMYVAQGGLGVAVLRAFTSVPGHALFGAVMGLHVGRARFAPRRAPLHLALALFWPILMHGLYNLPLLAAQAAAETGRGDEFPGLALLLTPLVLLLSTLYVVRTTRRLREDQLRLRAATPGT